MITPVHQRKQRQREAGTTTSTMGDLCRSRTSPDSVREPTSRGDTMTDHDSPVREFVPERRTTRPVPPRLRRRFLPSVLPDDLTADEIKQLPEADQRALLAGERDAVP